MGFYKLTIIIAIIHLIIFLAILGVIMSNSYSEKIYPNQLPTCPDFYTFDGSFCNADTNIYSFGSTSVGCSSINMNVSSFKPDGTNSTSGLCAKKTKANECKVSWDGITNNSDICKDV
jgi:hypothetical protein